MRLVGRVGQVPRFLPWYFLRNLYLPYAFLNTTTMSPTAAAHLERDLLAEVAEAVAKRMGGIARRWALKKVGKRALGALAALLVPDPTITKLIALGMGIWAAWDLIDIAIWVWEMRQWVKERLLEIVSEFLRRVQEWPDYDPNDPRWKRIMECIRRELEQGLREIDETTYRQSARMTIDRILERIIRCIANNPF